MTKKTGRRANPETVKARFLDLLTAGVTVIKAAEISGVARQTLYRWREADTEFAAQWAQAYTDGTDALADEAHRRALQGVAEPVFYQGQQIGTVQRYSDTLLMFLLKARDPERYCDRARTAALLRAWRLEDDKAGNARGGTDLSQSTLDMLAEVAAWKRSQAAAAADSATG